MLVSSLHYAKSSAETQPVSLGFGKIKELAMRSALL
jgi:hypothetical protein